MTEDQIERRAEQMMDKLDAEYLSTGMSADHYQLRVRQIGEWAWMQNFAIRIARRTETACPRCLSTDHTDSLGTVHCWHRECPL